MRKRPSQDKKMEPINRSILTFVICPSSRAERGKGKTDRNRHTSPPPPSSLTPVLLLPMHEQLSRAYASKLKTVYIIGRQYSGV